MLGNYLHAKRIERDLSISALARLAHISRTYVRRIEKGEIRLPSLIVLRSLASALDIGVDELIGAAGIEEPQSHSHFHSQATGDRIEEAGRQEEERLDEDEYGLIDGLTTFTAPTPLTPNMKHTRRKEAERGIRMYLRLKEEDQRLINEIAERLLAADELEQRMIAEKRSQYDVGDQPES